MRPWERKLDSYNNAGVRDKSPIDLIARRIMQQQQDERALILFVLSSVRV